VISVDPATGIAKKKGTEKLVGELTFRASSDLPTVAATGARRTAASLLS
jgi:hypothetical protein